MIRVQPKSGFTLLLVLVLVVTVGLTSRQSAEADDLTVFRVEDVLDTFPTGINARGDVAGYFDDSTGDLHGFVRDKHGFVATFDVPGSCDCHTMPAAISPNGTVVGTYWRANSQGTASFIRTAAGEFTIVLVPGSSATYADSINARGDVSGMYFGPGGGNFIRHANGNYETWAFGQIGPSDPAVINNRGVAVGDYNFYEGAFIREPNGSITTFSVPGAFITDAHDINSGGVIVGTAVDGSGEHGFIRDARGRLVLFDVAGANWTYPFGITPQGATAGHYNDADGDHVFTRDQKGTITTFDFPGTTGSTYFGGVNESGVVAGYGETEDGVFGFVWR